MYSSARLPAGFTLVEIIISLLIVVVLLSLGEPSFRRFVESVRLRSALDQVTGEIYRARMTAVRNGRPVYLILRSFEGCVTHLQMTTEISPGPGVTSVATLDRGEICLRHSGDSILIFNARGMLRPPSRSIFAAVPDVGDSVLVSIAGRVRRNY